jgi:hypothetical protein
MPIHIFLSNIDWIDWIVFVYFELELLIEPFKIIEEWQLNVEQHSWLMFFIFQLNCFVHKIISIGNTHNNT